MELVAAPADHRLTEAGAEPAPLSLEGEEEAPPAPGGFLCWASGGVR